MRRLSWKRNSVDRLFKLEHASRLDQIEAAFNSLGKSLDVNVKQTTAANEVAKRRQHVGEH